MKYFLLLCSVLFAISISTLGQESENYDYHPPLKIPLVLSSNFGELRPNHFHMGLDFKTNNRIGYNIYSIEDGFVSRVKISTYGYGKVVYIDHPNGVTSVYAHCSEFKGEIDSLIRITQEKEQNFEVEIFPGKDEIKVKKGQVIAISGNTGGSTAPHLHFEVRDTETEHALNPILYGFDMPDTKAPEIRNVKVYGITEDGYRIPEKEVSKAVTKSGASYIVSGNKLTVTSSFCSKNGGLGMAFDVIDRLDGASNKCGLYGSYLIVDGDTLFGQKTQRVPFESTRYVNSHKDYEAYKGASKKYHKSFRTSENDLPIYINNSHGILKTSPGQTHDVRYIAFDAKGNTSEAKFTLAISNGEMNSGDIWSENEDYVHPQETYQHNGESCIIEMGYATVYEPMKINEGSICSHIGDREEPVNRAYKIKLQASAPFDGKHYIKMVTTKGRVRALSVEYQDNWAVATSKYFGSYSLERDETSPSVVPSGFSNGSSISKSMLWKISDSESGIDDYDLFIDGKWYLVEYEYKNGKITFTKPSNLKGKKEIKVIVKDSCGNEKTWEGTINFI